MTDAPEYTRRDPEALRDPQGVRSEAWKQTNEEMEILAEERRENDWEVVTIPAVHVSIVPRDIEDESEFGFEYVIPDNHADAFSEAFDPDAVARYQVYRTIAKKNAFQVLELLAPETGTAIMLAGMFELQHATNILAAVEEENRVQTFVRTIDGTRLGMLEHEDYEPLIPDQIQR